MQTIEDYLIFNICSLLKVRYIELINSSRDREISKNRHVYCAYLKHCGYTVNEIAKTINRTDKNVYMSIFKVKNDKFLTEKLNFLIN